jgi:O-antigen biosynthesis protein
VVLCSGGLALKLVRMLRRLARTARRRKPPSVGATDPAAIGDGAAPLADELRRSGLFDTAWYVRHAGPIPEGEDPVDHYVRVGMTTGITPQPCFDPEWYLSRPETPKKLEASAFVHFVRRGAARGVSPHPLFDAQQYLLHHPDSIAHPGGPLGHYLKAGWLFDAQISAMVGRGTFAHGVGNEPEVSRPPFATFAGEVHDLLARTAGHEQLERTSKTFDQPASDSFVSEILAAYERVREELPLVSIVIPTKNRVQGVVEAVRSVLRQTYRHWQLIVVDDGSVDDTMDVLSTLFVDPRIELVHRPIAGGVSVARNAGLARARGSYVAYLDSDNTWEPRFLEIMVAFVRTTKLRFSYAVSELREQTANGRVGFRAVPFDREALQERNYIDCIVVLHERSLLDEVGGFDEDLRRNVDWDLFIRMAAVTDFGLVPFVATRYDPWEQRHDRITITEPFGYRHKVLAKHLVNWAQAADPPSDRKAGTVSIIITVSGSAPFLREVIERVLQCSGPDVDIVVVDAKLSGAEATVLQYLSFRHPRVHVRRERFTLSTEVARNLGAATVRSEVVVFLTADVRVEPGWLDPLVSPIRDRTAAACQPLVLRPDGTVWSAGTAHARGARSYNLFSEFPGDAAEVLAATQRDSLSARVLAVRAADFVSVEGFEPAFVDDFDSPDLSLRLAEYTGRPLRYVPTSLVSLLDRPERPTGSRARSTAAENQELFADRWRNRLIGSTDIWADAHLTVVGYDDERNTHLGWDPIVVRDRSPRPLRWALKIGAPTVARRTNWGDWHFALALKDALERRGQHVVIDCSDAWHRPTSRLDDVTLSLRGVAPYRTNPQHINLLWVISHSQDVTARELRTFDAVFAASPLLAERLTSLSGQQVATLLQCTDQRRFRPVAPDLHRRHEVLFVGNARGVRDSVGTALKAGIVPTVYGVRWDGLLPARAWAGDYIPNEELPAVYRAAGVVLNDHWLDMRESGVISNRLFDLAACGARIVSDRVAGLEEVFGESVLTYGTPETLAAAVLQHLNETAERREAREEAAERVRRDHTFDARADQLLDSVTRLMSHPEKSPHVSGV